MVVVVMYSSPPLRLGQLQQLAELELRLFDFVLFLPKKIQN